MKFIRPERLWVYMDNPTCCYGRGRFYFPSIPVVARLVLLVSHSWKQYSMSSQMIFMKGIFRYAWVKLAWSLECTGSAAESLREVLISRAKEETTSPLTYAYNLHIYKYGPCVTRPYSDTQTLTPTPPPLHPITPLFTSDLWLPVYTYTSMAPVLPGLRYRYANPFPIPPNFTSNLRLPVYTSTSLQVWTLWYPTMDMQVLDAPPSTPILILHP